MTLWNFVVFGMAIFSLSVNERRLRKKTELISTNLQSAVGVSPSLHSHICPLSLMDSFFRPAEAENTSINELVLYLKKKKKISPTKSI